MYVYIASGSCSTSCKVRLMHLSQNRRSVSVVATVYIPLLCMHPSILICYCIRKSAVATVYTELFQKECEGRFGITKDVVRDAIAQPDKEQRLQSQGLTLILYSKKMADAAGSSDDNAGGDYLVVNTHVQGQDLMVDLAFRLKKELVDEAKTTLPFPLMQALALRFGLPVKVGERETKFLYNEVIPVASKDIRQAMRISNPEGRPMVSAIWMRMLQNNMGFLAQCALVFCINAQAYAEWLAGGAGTTAAAASARPQQ